MARFVADGNDAFREANIAISGLGPKRWDIFAVRRDDGALVDGRAMDVGRTRVEPLTGRLRALIDAPELQCGGPLLACRGFVQVDDEIYLAASRPIRQTDESPAAIPGRMITATRLPDFVNRIRQMVPESLGIDVRGPRSVWPTVSVHDSRAYTTRALDGLLEPALLTLGVHTPLDAPGLLKATYTAFGFALVLATLAALTFAAWGVRRVVLRPLRVLSAAADRLARGEDGEVSPQLSAKDEFGALARAFDQMSSAVISRELALQAAESETRAVLDATGDGVVRIGFAGEVLSAPSLAARNWFGVSEGDALGPHLFEGSALNLWELGLVQLQDGFVPREVAVAQMPQQAAVGGRTFVVEYRLPPGRDEVVVVIADVTREREARRAEKQVREVHTAVSAALADMPAFVRFVADGDSLVSRLRAGTPSAAMMRELHTFKGTSAGFGLGSVAERVKAVEDAVARDGAVDAGPILALGAEWTMAVDRVRAIVPLEAGSSVAVPVAEISRLLGALEANEPYGRLFDRIAPWLEQTPNQVLDHLAHEARRIAEGLGKFVEVRVNGDARVSVGALADLVSAAVHAVRNALDHGVENPLERLSSGKPARALLELRLDRVGSAIRLTVRDDGRGIDWRRVAEKAAERGLPTATQADLEHALITDGFTTRDDADMLSGRGLGLAALRGAAEALGGALELSSTPGRGTIVVCEVPDLRPAWRKPRLASVGG